MKKEELCRRCYGLKNEKSSYNYEGLLAQNAISVPHEFIIQHYEKEILATMAIRY